MSDVGLSFAFLLVSVLFFSLQTEVLTFKPEFPEKFAGFTETAFFFPLHRRAFAPGAEHPCTAGIRRTAFTDAGFKVMV